MDDQDYKIKILEDENKRLNEALNSFRNANTKKWERRWWISKKMSTVFLGNGLKSSIKRFLTELSSNKTVSLDSTAELISQIFWRLTRFGLIALFIGLLPTIILFTQAILLNKQNRLINNQNERLYQQTLLQEAERRSNLVFLFANVMDAIDRELKNDVEKKGKRDLSPQLIGRITSLRACLIFINWSAKTPFTLTLQLFLPQ